MSRADDELTHMLRRAQRSVAVEGLFESLERRAARLVTKRHLKGRSRRVPGSVFPSVGGNHSSESSGK
jgi:hypothetical protein